MRHDRDTRSATARRAGGWLFGATLFAAATTAVYAQTEAPKPVDSRTADPKQYERLVTSGLAFLEKSQAEDGSLSKQAGPAVTALAVTAALRHGRTVNDPLVAKGLKYVEGFIQPDGSVCRADGAYKNYETSLAVLMFAAANRDGKYDALLKNADAFLKKLQWDGEEGHDKSSPAYGGAGYGNKKRPDLSNTNFLLDALKATGNGPESEAVQKALVFVSRCQNLEGPHNTLPAAAKVNDGGFYYTAFGDGDSQAGKTDNGGLRSYASMTYAGLKSMIFCGVSADDPRVKAAFEWAQKNYDLNSNPGMGQSGLYYYYHTLAKALDALNVTTIEAHGAKHDWRAELLVELARRQNADGSWANPEARWMEGDANLTTSYSLMTLSYLKPPAK